MIVRSTTDITGTDRDITSADGNWHVEAVWLVQGKGSLGVYPLIKVG